MNSLQRLLTYSQRYWKGLVLSILTAAAFGIISALPTYILKHTVDDIFIKQLHDRIVPFILLFMAFFLLKGLFSYLTSYSMHWVGNKVVNDLRYELFSKIMFFPLSFFQTNATGKIMSHFLNDIQMVQNATSTAIKNGVRSFFEAIFLIGFAFFQNWKLALLMLVVGPVMAFTIRKMGKAIKTASMSIQQEMGSISAMLQQDLIGIREIKAFNAEAIEVNRFKTRLDACFTYIMRNVHIDALLPAIIECIAMFGGAIAFYVAIKQVLSGSITPGQLSSFLAAVLLAYQPLKRLINVYAEIKYGLAAAQRIFDVIDTKQAVIQTSNPVTLHSFNDELAFKNVSFSYDTIPVLTDVNFTIKRGECIGIIGASGSGKSTLCDLIMGFIYPTAGTILIDQHNLGVISPVSLRTLIGYVGQQPFLFNDTVAANVAYAAPNATPSSIAQACQRAHAQEFIKAMADGYDAIVGENGALLSGGQKQRLTIARALLKNPEILIFDEATSSLDQKTEHEIQETIKALKGHKTILIISHRPSLLEIVDRRLLVQNGQVKEVGKELYLH